MMHYGIQCEAQHSDDGPMDEDSVSSRRPVLVERSAMIGYFRSCLLILAVVVILSFFHHTKYGKLLRRRIRRTADHRLIMAM